MNYKISIIGSGNLATHLAIALKKAKHNIVQIYSRNINNAEVLSKKVDAEFTNDIYKLKDADIYFISVSDDAISEILSKINENKRIVHTSGSTDIDVFTGKFENFGVFYPYQTFTKDRNISFSKIPICIEASNSSTLELLDILAQSISENVKEIDSKQRKTLHLSAVFACNFTNYMLTLSKDILDIDSIDFELSKELVKETIGKAFELMPQNSQTGPAKRNDTNIINNHIELLSYSPEIQKIYSLLTNNILTRYE